MTESRFILFFHKNKRIILSLISFLLPFLLLGIPFTKWGFSYDDFGMIWHSHVKSLKDIVRFFYEGSDSLVFHPSNYIVPEQTFFSVLYRPLTFVFRSVQSFFFGFSPYGYFLVMIFFHAFNSALLFNIFLYFVELKWAFWAAMFFAFHPSLCGWMGWITAFHQVVSFSLMLLVVLFFKLYLDTRLKRFYLFATVFFLMALFSRETAVVLPFWMVVAVFLHEKKNFFRSFKLTLSFWIITVFYLLLRVALFPIKLSGNGIYFELSPLHFFLNFKNRFFQLITFLSDLAGLSFMPGGHRILKGSLIILFLGLVFWLLIKNKKKGFVLFLSCGMIIFLWQAILRYYASRYLYVVLPFYILILLFFIKEYKIKNDLKFKKAVLCVVYLILIFNVAFLFSHLKKREKFLHTLHLAFDELCEDTRVHDRVLCFIGLPWYCLRTAAAQAVWMRGINLNLPIYYDRRTWVVGEGPIFKNYLKIVLIKDGFRIESERPDELWIACGGQEEFSMGKKIVHRRKNGNAVDASFIFDKKYWDQTPIFVTWDYEKLKFKLLDQERE